MHLGRGQYGAADHAFARALELRESVLGKEHPELVEVLEGRAAVLQPSRRDDEAGRAARRAEAIRDRLAG